jgi:hypothetical protein
MNESILALLPTDRYTQFEIYKGLQERWPQINDQTRVSLTDQRSVYISEPVDFNIATQEIPLSGWQRFKRVLFPWSWEDMSNPRDRAAYARRLWKALVTIPVPRFWRIAGHLTNNDRWIRRGMTLEPSMPASALGNTEQIDLIQFGYMDNNGYTWTCACGYHVATDTLYWRRL